uniref:Uncharacterized protein n=1 Tax=Neospora caninum (strain Liverpool) TaxID=572307 RepID=A0A0F7U6N0_NEOCL|nr:TPA: hypothetical protein BN1204_002375 [Neospora caninum Liverpool]
MRPLCFSSPFGHSDVGLTAVSAWPARPSANAFDLRPVQRSQRMSSKAAAQPPANPPVAGASPGERNARGDAAEGEGSERVRQRVASYEKATEDAAQRDGQQQRTLVSRVLTLERQVEALERALRENERQLKEFVIEKVLDLEDELRTLDYRHHSAAEAGFSDGREGASDSCSSASARPSLLVAEQFERADEVHGATVQEAEEPRPRSTSEGPFIIDTPCSVSTICTDTPRSQRGGTRHRCGDSHAEILSRRRQRGEMEKQD